MRAARITIVLGIAVLIVSSIAFGYSNTTTKQVFTSMLISDMQQVLGSISSTAIGYSTETITLQGQSVSVIKISFSHYSAFLIFRDPTTVFYTQYGSTKIGTAYKSLQMYGFIQSVFSPSCSKVDDFNHQFRGSRAYIDDDGDAILEADLYLSGGATPETVSDFVLRYITAFIVFNSLF